MINIDELKKKIIYRSNYRGTKEMDKLLSSFVKKHIDTFNESELKLLCDFLDLDDENLYKFKGSFLLTALGCSQNYTSYANSSCDIILNGVIY